jgi:roadblock/LC7 domain-containing protein
MKKLFNLVAIALAGILVTGMVSCKDDVVIEVATTSLEFDAAGVAAEGASVKVTGSAWNATSGEEWITITPASGVDGGSFTVTVTANEGGLREGSVVVAGTDGGDSKTVTVSQAALEVVIEAAPTALEFDATGLAAEEALVTVTGSDWTAASAEEWITVTPASGKDGESFTVTVTAADAARTGSIMVESTVEGVEAATVNVSQTAPIAVTGVELDAAKGHLILTDETKLTMTLTATVLPTDAGNQAVIWESSDSAIATVDNGVVTAVAPGTATITVTTDDGNFPAKCAITVTEFGFIIADTNLPAKMGWEAAQTACPEGWRIPSGEELQCMCRTYHSEGGDPPQFPSWPIDLAYWSSDTAAGIFGGETGAVVNFYTLTDPDCKLTGAMMNDQLLYVRCIQDVE